MKRRFPFLRPRLPRWDRAAERLRRLGRAGGRDFPGAEAAAAAGLALAGLLAAGCAGPRAAKNAGESPWLVAITDSPTHEWRPGKFVWHDLLTPDVSAARGFYARLFGWTFETEGPYTVIRNHGRKIGGLIEIKSATNVPTQALWLGSLSIPDVGSAVEFLKSEGGTLISGPETMKYRGRGALVSDPQGAHLLLLRAAGGDPPDQPAAPGDWLWDEIWTVHPADTIAFYQTLAGYDSLIETNHYTIFLKSGKWRAGVRHVAREKFRARWVPVVRVRDPAALLEPVAALGGRVWVRPEDPASNGDAALISDPTGAFLIVQRWN